jgi:hypothetical protein
MRVQNTWSASASALAQVIKLCQAQDGPLFTFPCPPLPFSVDLPHRQCHAPTPPSAFPDCSHARPRVRAPLGPEQRLGIVRAPLSLRTAVLTLRPVRDVARLVRGVDTRAVCASRARLARNTARADVSLSRWLRQRACTSHPPRSGAAPRTTTRSAGPRTTHTTTSTTRSALLCARPLALLHIHAGRTVSRAGLPALRAPSIRPPPPLPPPVPRAGGCVQTSSLRTSE